MVSLIFFIYLFIYLFIFLISLITVIRKIIFTSEAVTRMCSVKKGVLRNFTKLTGKPLCQSPLFNKVSGLASNFIKKETLAQVFSCEFYEISKNTFFTEHLRTTVSVIFPFSSGSFLYSLQVTLIKGGLKF